MRSWATLGAIAATLAIGLARSDHIEQYFLSREFYSMVRAHLKPHGYLVFDAPDGSCSVGDEGWRIYYSTLRSAGFDTVVSLVSRFDAQARAIRDAARTAAEEMSLSVQLPGGGSMPMTPVQQREFVSDAMVTTLNEMVQEFVLAFPDTTDVDATWTDLGVSYQVLTPHLLSLAFPADCPDEYDPDLVNSIFRPTLPKIWWLYVPTA